jgi:ElaB/YqjD/DUF883 family membrane-anchored ribosome-binding protein
LSFVKKQRLNKCLSSMLQRIEKMPTDHEADPTSQESLTSVNKAAMKADEAIRDTAQKYIDKAGLKLDLEHIETNIRRNPMPAVAIAAGAGFIVGGGMVTRLGLAMLTLFSRQAARETATNFIRGGLRPIAHGR